MLQRERFFIGDLADLPATEPTVYGSSAMLRARLIAVVSERCCFAESRETRRGMMRPRSVMKYRSGRRPPRS